MVITQISRRRAGTVVAALAAVVLSAFAAQAAPPPEGLDPLYGKAGMATVGGTFSNFYQLTSTASARAPGGGLLVAGIQRTFDGFATEILSVARFTAGGKPDTTFSGDGRLTFDPDPTVDSGVELCDVLAQPDGAVLVSSSGPYDHVNERARVMLRRFTATGAVDNTFSDDGRILFYGNCRQLGLRSDGRIVAVSFYTNPMSFIGAVNMTRLHPDGRFDETFGREGVRTEVLTTRVMAPSDITDVAMQGDKLVVVGSGATPTDVEWDWQSHGFVARFTASGAADKTFSGNGWLLYSGVSKLYDLDIGGQKVLVLGQTANDAATVSYSVVGRLTAAGAWDQTFSGDGFDKRPDSWPEAVATAAGGSVLVLANSVPQFASLGQPMLWRYDVNGVRDADFGGNGVVELAQCDAVETSQGLAACFRGVGVHPLADGRVVIGGSGYDCPKAACPQNVPYGSSEFNMPLRFAAARVLADPLPAIYGMVQPGESHRFENDTSYPVLVRLTSKSVHPVTVAYETVDGVATSGVDYTHVSGTLTFNPGQIQKKVLVPLLDDGVYEGPVTASSYHSTAPEDRARKLTFRLLQSSAAGATVPHTDTRLAIVDDESPPTIQLGPAPPNDTVLTVQESVGTAALPVRLSRPSIHTTWFDFQTYAGDPPGAPGYATPGDDFAAFSAQRVTFAPGETERVLPVDIVNDASAEFTEGIDITAIDSSLDHESVLGNLAGIMIEDDDTE